MQQLNSLTHLYTSNNSKKLKSVWYFLAVINQSGKITKVKVCSSYQMHRITQGDYGQQSSWDKERVKYVKKYKTLMYDSQMCLILLGAAAITWTRPTYLLGCWDPFPCLRAIHRVACPPAGVSIGHWSIIHTLHISKCVYLLIVYSGIRLFIYFFYFYYLLLLTTLTRVRLDGLYLYCTKCLWCLGSIP